MNSLFSSNDEMFTLQGVNPSYFTIILNSTGKPWGSLVKTPRRRHWRATGRVDGQEISANGSTRQEAYDALNGLINYQLDQGNRALRRVSVS